MLIVILSPCPSFAQNDIQQNSAAPAVVPAAEPRTMTVRKDANAPLIDGIVDEIWTGADSVSNFWQHSPYYGVAPSYRSTAKLLSTDEALYCLIVCDDPSGSIQQQSGMLDNYAGDFVSIMLDTFNDRKSAYKLIVSAAGTRGDARLLDDGRNRDYSWDGVWFSAAETYPWGYVVEMEIPYRSIQYDKNLDEWGLDFDRWIPVKSEDIYWSPYEEAEGLRVSRFGRLRFEGFRPAFRGLNFEFYPVGLLKAEYVRDGVYDISPTAGLDLFYNPSPSLTFQLTGNPDFARIEADPFAFNISRYETFSMNEGRFSRKGRKFSWRPAASSPQDSIPPWSCSPPAVSGACWRTDRKCRCTWAARSSDAWEYRGFVAQTGGNGIPRPGSAADGGTRDLRERTRENPAVQ